MMSWSIAVLLMVAGGLLISQGVAVGWGLLVAGISFVPPIWDWLRRTLPFRESGLLRGALSAAFLMVGILAWMNQEWRTNTGTSTRSGDATRTGEDDPYPDLAEIAAQSDPSKGRYFAYLFAAEEYAPHFPDLDHPIKDAKALRAVLESSYSFEHPVRLIENPTKNQIVDTLVELNGRMRENDNLLIFYAGHGAKDWKASQEGAWIPAHAGMSTADWFKQAELAGLLKNMKAKHVLVVIDACFGGSMLLTGRTRAAINAPASHYYAKRSCRVMTSGSEEEVPDESRFVNELVDQLRTSGDPHTPADAVFERVRANLERSGYDRLVQHARLEGTFDELGDFVFVRRTE